LSASPRQVWSWCLMVLELSCRLSLVFWWAGGQCPSGLEGLWGKGPAGQQPGRSATWCPAGQRHCLLVGRWQPTCSFSVLWHGEAFHSIVIQGTKVSALPCVLPYPSMSPASQQGPWFPELMQSASVSQSPYGSLFNLFLLLSLLFPSFYSFWFVCFWLSSSLRCTITLFTWNLFPFMFFFPQCHLWTQNLAFAMQTLYHLSCSLQDYLLSVYFYIGSSSFPWVCSRTMILLYLSS
jgi:hypothetical protein